MTPALPWGPWSGWVRSLCSGRPGPARGWDDSRPVPCLLQPHRRERAPARPRHVRHAERVTELVVHHVPLLADQVPLVRRRAMGPSPCVDNHPVSVAAQEPTAGLQRRTQGIDGPWCCQQHPELRNGWRTNALEGCGRRRSASPPGASNVAAAANRRGDQGSVPRPRLGLLHREGRAGGAAHCGAFSPASVDFSISVIACDQAIPTSPARGDHP